jgi:HSP20 family protein
MKSYRSNALATLFHPLFDMPEQGIAQDAQTVQRPALDVLDHDHCYELFFDMPGAIKENIDVSWHEGVLTVEAKRKPSDHGSNAKLLRCERSPNRYHRRLEFVDEVHVDAIEANYTDGTLHLIVPKRVEPVSQPQRIVIQ